jgi:peptidoglycan/xylan/chitin deacetylase (PgdA/CDA1 family)
MRFFRPGLIPGWIYPEAIFRITTADKILYLTFDDGPHPDSTPELIKLLHRHNVKGHFFVDGRAAEKFPEIVGQIISAGHAVGNHGYSHYDGWRTSEKKYLEDVSCADAFINSRFFRPPFGRMKIGQYRKLKAKYKIVLWDLMAYDFDKKFGKEKSLLVLKKKIRPGSIIVLHDTPASATNSIIGEFITYTIECGYRFEVIAEAPSPHS